ncbi:uncharacterized protein LOC141620383 [Silene latifolia]|uniref:uncharacterized protein LOC141620383 n=1 Tax=Silene latifolia TaxID=37657 RepID=UPI003D77AC5B
MRDFRPISLCNVVYKIVSKVLANRLKLFLGDIVSENQSAFTPGRLITDNILIAFELFHYMKNSRHSEGHMAIKLDMAKAYDRVEWSFLRRVLVTMGVDGDWICRVMDCVSTVTFSVLINGTPSEDLRPTRGLRQGDLVSPYLFILCAEALSNLMRRAVEENSLHGIRISRSAPAISHLLFADDSIFFARATLDEADIINNVLRQYESASGQLVSLEKTTVSFSQGVSNEQRIRVAERLGVGVVKKQKRYLGLPTLIGRSKKVITDIIRDKLCKRLQGWRGKLLSRAGKEVPIKAVANSLPTYVMSVFKIQAKFCDELRSMISRFWWGHEEGKRAKQAWRLFTCPDSLWARMMKAKYYSGSDFLGAELGHNPSYAWRSIWEARGVLVKGLRRRIGDGNHTRVWRDAWVPSTQSGRVISPCPAGQEELLVASLITGDQTWDVERINMLFLPFERERITNIRLSPNRPRDRWYWSGERDGAFSVKSAYRLLARDWLDMAEQSDSTNTRWLWNKLWKVPVWPCVKLFFWQLCNDALATKANIASRGKGESSLCSLCNLSDESSIHLFRDCRMARWVWEQLELRWEGEERMGGIRCWVEERWRDMSAAEYDTFMVGCWAIWEHRNKIIFDEMEVEPERERKREKGLARELSAGGRRRGVVGVGNGPNGVLGAEYCGGGGDVAEAEKAIASINSIIQDFKSIASCFHCCSLSFCPNGVNRIAHNLAQEALLSIKHPMGILEDVPVKIGKFLIPVDFVVIDITEDSRVPIILGRPFLHTAGANPPDAPTAASYPWRKEVDEIERLIYGDDPSPEMTYSSDKSIDIEGELDALEAEIFKEEPVKVFQEAHMTDEEPYLLPMDEELKSDGHACTCGYAVLTVQISPTLSLFVNPFEPL